MITTATASGKSLCYTLPFFQAYAHSPSTTRALFLFPTKVRHDPTPLPHRLL